MNSIRVENIENTIKLLMEYGYFIEYEIMDKNPLSFLAGFSIDVHLNEDLEDEDEEWAYTFSIEISSDHKCIMIRTKKEDYSEEEILAFDDLEGIDNKLLTRDEILDITKEVGEFLNNSLYNSIIWELESDPICFEILDSEKIVNLPVLLKPIITIKENHS